MAYISFTGIHLTFLKPQKSCAGSLTHKGPVASIVDESGGLVTSIIDEGRDEWRL